MKPYIIAAIIAAFGLAVSPNAQARDHDHDRDWRHRDRYWHHHDYHHHDRHRSVYRAGHYEWRYHRRVWVPARTVVISF